MCPKAPSLITLMNVTAIRMLGFNAAHELDEELQKKN